MLDVLGFDLLDVAHVLDLLKDPQHPDNFSLQLSEDDLLVPDGRLDLLDLGLEHLNHFLLSLLLGLRHGPGCRRPNNFGLLLDQGFKILQLLLHWAPFFLVALPKLTLIQLMPHMLWLCF